jgi:hypothetical protein
MPLWVHAAFLLFVAISDRLPAAAVDRRLPPRLLKGLVCALLVAAGVGMVGGALKAM